MLEAARGLSTTALETLLLASTHAAKQTALHEPALSAAAAATIVASTRTVDDGRALLARMLEAENVIGDTPLVCAARSGGSNGLVELLACASALCEPSVAARLLCKPSGSDGATPLHMCVARGDSGAALTLLATAAGLGATSLAAVTGACNARNETPLAVAKRLAAAAPASSAQANLQRMLELAAPPLSS